MAKKMFSVIETDAFAIQFMDGSFYNGLDSYGDRYIPYRDRVRTSTETLRTFKTLTGAEAQVNCLKLARLSCDVIPVRIGIFPR